MAAYAEAAQDAADLLDPENTGRGRTAAGVAVATQIEEGIADYQDIIDQLAGTSGFYEPESVVGPFKPHRKQVGEKKTGLIEETEAEGARRIQQTKAEGIANLKELGKQAAYESGVANVQGQMTASGQTAKLGASGARATGSPLLAAQQASDIARAAAGEKTRAGNAGISLGGLKLGGSLADIQAATTLLTNEYGRKLATAKRKQKSLEENKEALVNAADIGQIVDWTGRIVGIGISIAGLL
jgi:hypothetical protein